MGSYRVSAAAWTCCERAAVAILCGENGSVMAPADPAFAPTIGAAAIGPYLPLIRAILSRI